MTVTHSATHFRLFSALTAALLLAGCAAGPDYVRPAIEVPAAYKEGQGYWRPAAARDDPAPAAWWEIFGDPQLARLVADAERANPSLAAAEAAYRQAVAAVGGARAGLFPNLAASAAASRGKTAGSNGSIGNTRSTDRVGLASSWELDLWGRLRRGAEAAEDTAAASAGDLAAARLSVQAALVQSYFQLRINDAQQRLLAGTLAAYRRSHEITRNRYQAGIASQADVAQAETQLKGTEAQAIDLGIQRAQLEHAIAALTGRVPGTLELAADERIPGLPALPAALPSTLLERRPDVAAAERRVAAANAQIGVAQAAFFPSLTINASGGYQNNTFADLLSAPYRFWSLGPSLALTLFDAGARSAAKEQALAGYDKSVAGYRQTVLTAFQEVEDNLAALRILAAESEVQKSATRAANEFQTLTTNQYLAGTVSFLNVATAQAAALAAERASLDLLNRQLAATVGLIKALGGGV